MAVDPRSFLATIGGYLARDQAGASANRPVKLATVDPTYTGTGPPRVTFDGETTLSSKVYAFVDSYRPAAGDRVALIPVGTTYLIAGKIDNSATGRPVRTVNLQSLYIAATGDLNPIGTSYQDIPGCSRTFSVSNSTAVALVDGVYWYEATSNSTNPSDTAVGALTVDGTVWVPPEQTLVGESTSVFRPGATPSAGANGTYPQHWRVPLTVGSHTLKLQAKRSGTIGTWRVRALHSTLKILVLDF